MRAARVRYQEIYMYTRGVFTDADKVSSIDEGGERRREGREGRRNSISDTPIYINIGVAEIA